MPRQIWSILIIASLILSIQAACKKDFWNQILYYKGELSQKDYVNKQIKQTKPQGSSNIDYGPFCLQVFSNRTFAFQIDYLMDATLLTTGEAAESQQQNSVYLFNLISSEQQISCKGQISFNYSKNLEWVYAVNLSDLNIALNRQVEVSALNFQITKIIIVISMMIILPITEKRRAQMLYEIRIRTNIITVVVTASKIIFLLTIMVMHEGFLLKYYGFQKKDNYFSTSSILMALLILHLMVIFLLPLMMYILYMVSVMIKWFQNSEKFKQKTEGFRILAIVLTITIILVISVFITKGLIFHSVLSLSIIPTLIHSVKTKKYIYGRFIIFDLLLNFSITLFSLYLPVYRFSLISYRQAAMLWNFQFGLLILSLIIAKKIIAIEPQQPITAEQLNCEMSPWTKHQPLQQNDNRGTIQIIE